MYELIFKFAAAHPIPKLNLSISLHEEIGCVNNSHGKIILRGNYMDIHKMHKISV